MDDRLPGFTGLLQLGHTPDEAWKIIRDATVAEPGARELFEYMASTPDGLAALEFSRRQWDERGFRPPWSELLGGNPDA